MEQVSEIFNGLKRRYMKAITKVLDPGYIILAWKKVPLSKQEQQFSDIYENTICLHSLNIVLTVPSVVYYYHYFMASRKKPLDQKRMGWARRRIMLFVPLCFASMVTAYAYQKSNDFQGRLREIQQFYLNRKDQDINEVSFTSRTIQPS